MDAVCSWMGQLTFDASLGAHVVTMDGKRPIGNDHGATPKDLVLAALSGCTAMDVISLLRKAKQPPTSFRVLAHAEPTTSHPVVFKDVRLVYETEGSTDPEVIVDAVRKSMTLYCGVTAMVSATCPVSYMIRHNDQEIGHGEAHFQKG